MITLDAAMNRSSHADELQELINRGSGVNTAAAATTGRERRA
jgi:hypothetical protein